MLRAILLDLDNTMVLYDEPAYYERYFVILSQHFSDMFTPEQFIKRVIHATMALIENNGEVNNSHYFIERFTGTDDQRKDQIWQRFMHFYETEYQGIEIEVRIPDGLHDSLARWRQDGLKLVVASNPVFPIIALEKRMAWAGIDKFSFDLATHIENMSYVKPRLEYYLQISEMIGEASGDCLMVGNDPVNDMAAKAAGMKTFLTTEAGVIDYTSVTLGEEQRRRPQPIPPPDFSGPFAAVASAVQQLRDLA
jgi:FMN phosphatase YigB (HAD superfamily)